MPRKAKRATSKTEMQCSQIFERPAFTGGLYAMQEAAKLQEEMLRELYLGRNCTPLE